MIRRCLECHRPRASRCYSNSSVNQNQLPLPNTYSLYMPCRWANDAFKRSKRRVSSMQHGLLEATDRGAQETEKTKPWDRTPQSPPHALCHAIPCCHHPCMSPSFPAAPFAAVIPLFILAYHAKSVLHASRSAKGVLLLLLLLHELNVSGGGRVRFSIGASGGPVWMSRRQDTGKLTSQQTICTNIFIANTKNDC